MKDLSAPKQRLLRLFQAVNFGRVEELEVRDGEPQFSPPPRVFVELKLDVENGARQESGLEQFPLRSQVVRFFTQLSRLEDGTVECIDIRHGLPFRIVVEAMPAEVEP
ncbi:MAG: hypothetical protein IT167_18585 [Bryobacterales bacterium]|nr:hypothetical protein [Bryobacterales bacterium]